MRQAIAAPVFEGCDQATFTAGMKAKMPQPAPSTWYGKLISMLSPGVGQDPHEVRQSIAELVETDRSQELVQAVEKT